MANITLWQQLQQWKSPQYKWIELTHELSSETPHWYGFKPLVVEKLFDYPEAPMRVYEYTNPGQYGTHVDVPLHFHATGRAQHEIMPEELVYPLVVIDESKAVKNNPDFILTTEDLKKWEEKFGTIPEGAFVAFRSDWHKRSADVFNNYDEKEIPHYPGWDINAIKWLVEERRIGAIGHETSDTDPGFVTSNKGSYPYPAEQYILQQDRIQIELLANLDQVPAVGSIIVVSFPKIKDGTGSPARCFAISPIEE